MTAKVFLLRSANEFDDLYTYSVPEEFEDKIVPGVFVSVPFGKRGNPERALVRSVQKENSEGYILANGKEIILKQIKSVDENSEHFTEKMLNLCEKIHDRYICTWGAAAKLMIPSSVSEKENTVKMCRLRITVDDAEKLSEGNELRNINQIKAVDLLRENGPVSVNEIMSITGMKTDAALKTLEKHGYIEIFKEKSEEKNTTEEIDRELSKPPELNPEQKNVFDKVKGFLEEKKFREILLFGVTSGGKTEVYMQLVAEAVKNGGSAVVLVPEISLTPQMTGRFTERFGNTVAVIHSRLSDGEKKREWLRMKRGEAKIVVGARSAVFAPFENVGLYIIDEEQEWTYKSEETPRYHAKEVAVMRAKEENAVVLYGSATPNVETFYRSKTGQTEYAEILHRATKNGLPDVCTVDMREEVQKGNSSVFSEKLYGEMKKNLENGEQTVIFVQRRGYSRDLICESCGKTMICGKCNLAMTVHEKQGRLICHYCGNTVKIPSECPNCASQSLKRMGFGTERVEEEIKKLFPKSKVVRMDTDTTSRKNGHSDSIKKFTEEKADFLVGTQMIAKGHDFPGVTLVGVVSADSLLNMKEYTAAENAFQLLTQVCGRAGRGEKSGRVIIQTFNLDSYALKAAVRQDYFTFYKDEMNIRSILNYPPFCSMGSVVFSGENDRETYDRANEAFDIMFKNAKKNGIIKMELLGPARCSVPKIKDRYRWRLTLKAENTEKMLRIMKDFSTEYDRKHKYSAKDTVSCHVEV